MCNKIADRATRKPAAENAERVYFVQTIARRLINITVLAVWCDIDMQYTEDLYIYI